MYLNGFSVRVHPGTEVPGGYVEMTHGMPYELHLRNQNSTACDAQVFVDGKDIGTFRLDANTSSCLVTQINRPGCFTFYRAASSEAQQAGIASISVQDYGLVRVVFTPEKIKERVVKVNMAPLSFVENTPMAGAAAVPDYATTYTAATRSAGITGLSGHSQQQFISVGPLEDYDYTRQTTIHLRLVERGDGPRPIVSVATAIPPVVAVG